jgi:hypothetical protein
MGPSLCIIEEIEQSAISAALNGSREHGESGGIQMITWTYGCTVSTATRQYGPGDCGPQYERVIRKE